MGHPELWVVMDGPPAACPGAGYADGFVETLGVSACRINDPTGDRDVGAAIRREGEAGCSDEDRCRKRAQHVVTGHAVPYRFDHGSPRGDSDGSRRLATSGIPSFENVFRFAISENGSEAARDVRSGGHAFIVLVLKSDRLFAAERARERLPSEEVFDFAADGPPLGLRA
jgi:hypothetical protein